MKFEAFCRTLSSEKAAELRAAMGVSYARAEHCYECRGRGCHCGLGEAEAEYRALAQRAARISTRPISVTSGRPARRGSNDTPNSWMSENLQRFYRGVARKRKTDEALRSVDSRSVLGRQLRIEREFALIEQDSDLETIRASKSRLDNEWREKDPWAIRPL